MFAMVLDPRKKLSYFQKHWPKNRQKDANKNMEATAQRYIKLNAATRRTTVSSQKARSTGCKQRRRAVTPEEDDDPMSDLSATHIDPLRPWLDEYQGYLAVREAIPEGMSTLEWWGRNYYRHPVWGSLACDYLAIMVPGG
ncbi:hypothetical protein B0H13DRAFT_2373910 [Mycena leptocephala]|nr:hypothetical protein B0H13DRAFT_2373910 [Mycena leptocephala]